MCVCIVYMRNKSKGVCEREREMGGGRERGVRKRERESGIRKYRSHKVVDIY